MSWYKIDSLEEYFKAYRESVDQPEKFWEDIAEENFVWRKKWDKVLEYDLHEAQVKWVPECQTQYYRKLYRQAPGRKRGEDRYPLGA